MKTKQTQSIIAIILMIISMAFVIAPIIVLFVGISAMPYLGLPSTLDAYLLFSKLSAVLAAAHLAFAACIAL